jgi:hypothetical protein
MRFPPGRFEPVLIDVRAELVVCRAEIIFPEIRLAEGDLVERAFR